MLAFAGIGLYEGLRFLGFYQLRRDPRLFYTGLLSLVAGLYALIMVLIYAQPSAEAVHGWTRWRYAISAFFPVALVGATETLLSIKRTWLRLLTGMIGVVVSTACFITPTWVYSDHVRVREVQLLQQTFYDFQPAAFGYLLFAWSLLVVLYISWLIIRNITRRDFFSFTAFAIAAFIIFGLLDLATVLGLTNLPFFLEFGCVLAVMATNRSLLMEYFDLLNEKEKLVNMRARLLSNISHELRTPLGAAMGYLQILLRRPSLGPEERGPVERALAALQNETELINQLIDISRFAAENPEVNRAPIQVRAMLAELFERLKLLADKKQIELVATGDLDISINADPKWFPLAVKNLVHNAIKFSPQGSKIKVHVQMLNNDLSIAVRDRGRGIPLREQQAIFGRFSQGSDAKDNDVEAGLGIGLALVRDVAQAHGGSVKLSSRVWKGSVFEIRIPQRSNKLQSTDSTPLAASEETTAS